MSADGAAQSHAPLRKLLSDLQFLGPLRFVVVGSGAILESVAEVGAVSYKVRRAARRRRPSRARAPTVSRARSPSA
jgi:hypothetical protein